MCAKRKRTPERGLIKELLPLMVAGERSGVAKLLHGWEAASVKRLKLEECWQPTPFPIEI